MVRVGVLQASLSDSLDFQSASPSVRLALKPHAFLLWLVSVRLLPKKVLHAPPAMTVIRLLHVSDVHARADRHRDFQIVFQAQREALADITTAHGRTIDAICLTGDVAYSGSADEYTYAKDAFLEPLRESLGLPVNAVFICPGNHDVDRAVVLADPLYEEQLRRTLTRRDEVNALLDSADARDRAFARLDNYQAFLEGYCGGFPDAQDGRFFVVRLLDLRDVRIAIACLNSTWRSSSDEDWGRLVVGERQIDLAADRMRESTLRIALLHHPLSWLAEFEQRTCIRRLPAEVDIVLMGHLHDPQPHVEQSPQGRCLFSYAGSVFDGRRFNGFSIVEIDSESMTGQVLLWRYYDDRRAFDLDLATAPDGRFPFDLGPRGIPASHRRPASPPLGMIDRELLIAEARRRQRVKELLSRVRDLYGGAFVLGASLGIVAHIPLESAGRTAPAEIAEAAVEDVWVQSLVLQLSQLQKMIDSGDESVDRLAETLHSIAHLVTERYGTGESRTIIERLDRVVQVAVDPGADVGVREDLAAADAYLSDHQPAAALDVLQRTPAASVEARALKVEALYELADRPAVIALLGTTAFQDLSQREAEFLVLAFEETGDIVTAQDTLERYRTRFDTMRARLFIQTTRRRLHDRREGT